MPEIRTLAELQLHDDAASVIDELAKLAQPTVVKGQHSQVIIIPENSQGEIAEAIYALSIPWMRESIC